MKDTMNKNTFKSRTSLLRKWRYYSYLVGKDETNDNIEKANKLIEEIEQLMPFKDKEEHEHWLDVLTSYKFWEDFEELTLEIINRKNETPNLDKLLESYRDVAMDVCEDANFYDLFETFAKLSHNWVATIDEWNDWYKKMSENQDDIQDFFEMYEEIYGKPYKREDVYRNYYGFETCTHPMFYKNDIESKDDLIDCIFDRYISGLDNEEELWFLQKLIKELI